MTLRDVPVGETLDPLSHPLKVHFLILYLRLIPREDLSMIRDPMQSQACYLHYSHGLSANAAGAALPLRNQPLMTAPENCDTVDVVTKNLADPSLIRLPYWIDLAILSNGRVCMWNGDVEAKIDKAFRGTFIGRGCDAAGRTIAENAGRQPRRVCRSTRRMPGMTKIDLQA